MVKSKLFLDMDSTLVHSVKQFCKVYNILYRNRPQFIPADYTKLQKYNLKCICPLVENILDLFEHELFFTDLEFIDEDTYEVLEKLNEKYEIIIVTIGTPLNLARKSIWLKQNVPFIKNYILLYNDGCKMDKSLVAMQGEGNVFLDDVEANLHSVTCERKILFGKRYEWNNLWNGEYALTWSDVGRLLL